MWPPWTNNSVATLDKQHSVIGHLGQTTVWPPLTNNSVATLDKQHSVGTLCKQYSVDPVGKQQCGHLRQIAAGSLEIETGTQAVDFGAIVLDNTVPNNSSFE
jgi:hypothetical protein